MLADVEDTIAQDYTIFEGFEIERIFLCAGNPEIFGLAAEGEDQIVIGDRTGSRLHLAAGDID